MADVHTLDLSDNCVDGVFVRWLLCFVKNPKSVISEVARVLRPGGSLVVMDYFNYKAVNIFPNRESFSQLFNAYYQSLLDHGGTYDIGHLLPQIISDNDLEIVSLQPINRIAQPGSDIWKWLLLFTESYLPKLIEDGYLNLSDQKTLIKDFEAAEKDPGAFFYTPPIVGIVAKK